MRRPTEQLELSHKIYHLDRGKCTVISTYFRLCFRHGRLPARCSRLSARRRVPASSLPVPPERFPWKLQLHTLNHHSVVSPMDHSADTDDRVIPAGLCHGRCRNRDLERSPGTQAAVIFSSSTPWRTSPSTAPPKSLFTMISLETGKLRSPISCLPVLLQLFLLILLISFMMFLLFLCLLLFRLS